jgi:hypothetical protein
MVHATKEPHATAGGLTWEAVIPARHEWTVEVIAQAVVESRPIEPRFRDIVIDGEPALEKSAWLSQVSAFKSHHATLGQVLQRSLHDLDALRMVSTSDPKRMFMAAGAPWFMTLFGRDSILTAWMTLPVDAHVALGTLHTLASLQGTEFDPLTEEEPGRILHESRLGPTASPRSVAAITTAPSTRRRFSWRCWARRGSGAPRRPTFARCCPPRTWHCPGWTNTATVMATASWNTSAPPTAAWPTRAGRTAGTP